MVRSHNSFASAFVFSFIIKVHTFIIGLNELNFTSNNSMINLTSMGFSKNNIAGIGQDGLAYTYFNANKNVL